MQKCVIALLLIFSVLQAHAVSPLARQTAEYALDKYADKTQAALAEMVRYKTVAIDGLAMEKNPEFTGFKNYIQSLSKELGLKYQDLGYMMVVSIGTGKERVGVMTHGDVQPADPSKWAKSPFELDSETKPGFLYARGTEDDKGPIATAMYAMKAIKDKRIELDKTIELMIYMAEESNWDPMRELLKTWQPPQINVTIDAEYPVVTAENGWSTIQVTVPTNKVVATGTYISEFGGGAFGSQIPEDAKAVIKHADKALVKQLKSRSKKHPNVKYHFTLNGDTLTVTAKGKSAHSSKPQEGINAIGHLAELLAIQSWPKTAAGATVNYLNDLVGTGIYAEKFGNIAYQDDFMGAMTLAPTKVSNNEKGIRINLNLRRPIGKSGELLTEQTNKTLAKWQKKQGVKLEDIQTYFGEPLVVKDAPHVGQLLKVFSYYTGIENPQPVSIGGSTNAKLLPNAVSFGPSMPGAEYTGHSEHEHISVQQLRLNLEMYTAMMMELAGGKLTR